MTRVLRLRVRGPAIAAILCATLGLSPGGRAQTATASEPPVLLSEFNVTATTDPTYIASESVTGSRVTTKIADLPFSVNVVTSEFLNDFDAFDIDANLGYTSSLSGLDTQGNYNLRGFGATFQLRNGFYRLGLVDRVNIDRIEVIKGPNAALYGQTSPAGLVNIISNRPKTTPAQRLSVTAGDNHLLRGELNVTGPLGSIGGVKLYHVFSASAMERDEDVAYAHLKQRALSEGLLAKFSDRTSVFLELEWSKRDAVAAVNATPFVVVRQGNRYVYTRQLAEQFKYFNQAGPTGIQDREMATATATLEHRINGVFSSRVSGYFYDRSAFNFNTSAGDQYDPVLNLITSRNPNRSNLNEDGGAAQADLLARYRTGNGAMDHKTLLTLDWSTNWRYRKEARPLSSVYPSSDINLNAPNFTVPSLERWNITTRNDKTRNDVRGVYLRQQTAMLDGRLLAFGGVRYDHVTFNLKFGDTFNPGGARPGSLNNTGYVEHFTDDAWSPSVGLNYKLTPQIAVYANWSRSFFPNAQSSRLGDRRLPNETADGFDVGVKAAFLNERLVFTLGAYSVTRDGVKATVIENGTTIDRAAGVQEAEGVELDFTWRVTDDLTVLGGYGYTDARIAENGRDTDSIGRRPNGVPVGNGGVAVRYQFPGALRGFSANLGVKYLGEANPNSLATVAGGAPDLARRETETPAYTTVDAGVTYSWGRRAAYRQSVRVSARNLLEEDYFTPNLRAGDRRAFYFAYTVSH